MFKDLASIFGRGKNFYILIKQTAVAQCNILMDISHYYVQSWEYVDELFEISQKISLAS